MSEMHAETATWIDGLRGRADKAEAAIRHHPDDHPAKVDAHERLRDLRRRLDDAERGHPSQDHRTNLQKLADDLEHEIAHAFS